jgi:pyruvate formate lyase activating enzyme
MNIGGLQKTSLLDYPGKIAAIIWTVGCNFRCPFCYNPQLITGDTKSIPIQNILDFLETRKGKLEAVSITGGEPLLHEDIEPLITSIKEKGYLVKIDTNGSYPDRLNHLLQKNLLDYVSMDIKTSKEHYDQVAGTSVDIDSIDTSIRLIQERAPNYEFKTTVIPLYHTKDEIIKIAEWLEGSKRYFLQQFKTDTALLSPDLINVKPYSKEILQDFCKAITSFFKECAIRGIDQ